MNVFPFDPCPMLSARALDDKRLRRVFQEACMLQSNVQWVTHGTGPYQRVPVPHPIADWLGLRDNFKDANAQMARQWLYDWMHHLAAECLVRFDGFSSWATTEKFCVLADRQVRVPYDDLVFCNMARSEAKGLDYTHITAVHQAYRAYVGYQWRYRDTRPVLWTLREAPDWFKEISA